MYSHVHPSIHVHGQGLTGAMTSTRGAEPGSEADVMQRETTTSELQGVATRVLIRWLGHACMDACTSGDPTTCIKAQQVHQHNCLILTWLIGMFLQVGAGKRGAQGPCSSTPGPPLEAHGLESLNSVPTFLRTGDFKTVLICGQV